MKNHYSSTCQRLCCARGGEKLEMKNVERERERDDAFYGTLLNKKYIVKEKLDNLHAMTSLIRYIAHRRPVKR